MLERDVGEALADYNKHQEAANKALKELLLRYDALVDHLKTACR